MAAKKTIAQPETLPAVARPVAEPDPGAGDKKRQIGILARSLNQIGWGNVGTVIGMQEEVDIVKVWANPLHPVVHTEDEIEDMAQSLLHKGQEEVVLVCYATDGRRLEDGGTGGSLMLEDGHLRYLGALRAGLDKIRVTVRPFQDLTSVLLDWGQRAVFRHTPRGFEIGLSIVNAYEAHRVESLRNPSMLAFPSQEDLGLMYGRSQETINQWIRLGRAPTEFQDLIRKGDLSEAQALELVRESDPEKLLARAFDVAARSKHRAVSSKQIRHERERFQGALFPDQLRVPGRSLLAWTLTDDTPPPVVTGYLARDLQMQLTTLIEESKSQRVPVHPALTKLLRALMDPAITAFTETLGEE